MCAGVANVSKGVAWLCVRRCPKRQYTLPEILEYTPSPLCLEDEEVKLVAVLVFSVLPARDGLTVVFVSEAGGLFYNPLKEIVYKNMRVLNHNFYTISDVMNIELMQSARYLITDVIRGSI